MTTLARLLWSAALTALLLTVPAHAGPYEVRTCGDAPAGAEPAWTFATTDAATIGGVDGCADGTGLQVFEHMGPGPLANLGDEGWWTFAAPDNTRITAARLRRYLHTYSDAGWIAETRADDTVLDHCHIVTGVDCYVGTPGGLTTTFPGLDAQALRIGGFCVPEGGHTACERGAFLHSLETYLYAATVTLDDQQPPTSSLAAAGLADGAGWKTGPGTLTTAAADNTGVRRREVRVDDHVVAAVEAPPAAEGGCRTLGEGLAYSFTQPCLGPRGVNGERTDTFDPRTWPQGARELRVVAVDTGGATTTSEARPIRIDTQPPPAPVVQTSPGASPAPSVTVSAGDPSGGSPLQRVDLWACRAGDCHARTESLIDNRVAISWDGLPDGTWHILAKVRDAAGHLGAESTAVEARVARDPVPPATEPPVAAPAPVPPPPPVPPPAPVTTAPTVGTPAPRCRVRISSAKAVRGGKLLVRGTVRAGRRVTVTAVRSRRRTTAVDRTTRTGRFELRLKRPRGTSRRIALSARASGCATATRRITLR